MFPERRVRAPKTAIVITAKTTPYSAMVCPSSRDCSAAKSFCTCFTSLLVLGRRSGAADDDKHVENENNVPAFFEPFSCLAALRTLKPNSSVRPSACRAASGSTGGFIVLASPGGDPPGRCLPGGFPLSGGGAPSFRPQ